MKSSKPGRFRDTHSEGKVTIAKRGEKEAPKVLVIRSEKTGTIQNQDCVGHPAEITCDMAVVSQGGRRGITPATDGLINTAQNACISTAVTGIR